MLGQIASLADTNFQTAYLRIQNNIGFDSGLQIINQLHPKKKKRTSMMIFALHKMN